MDIKGKVALVTGGAAGIGHACCVELLKNGIKGVVIADINKNGQDETANLNKTYGEGKAIFIQTDVTDANQFEAAFKQTISAFGGLDIVVNNAGVLNDANWQLEIAINVGSVVQGSLLGMKYMGKNNGGKGGVIVNMASILGLQELDGCPVYVGCKHFVVGLDRSLGSDYYFNITGVRFVTICPGVTDTRLVAEAENVALQGFPNLGKILANELASHPTQEPKDVAAGIITLIAKGKNGSVWVSEGEEPVYEVAIPDRKTLRKQ